MKNYLPWAVSTVLSVVLFFQIFKKEEIRTITIPSKSNSVIIDAPKPIVIHDTIFLKSGDTIYKPLVNPVNQELLKKYINITDSISQVEFVKDVITERTYKETLSDSTQTVTVKSLVRGTLLNQSISYITKPSEFVIKPINKVKRELYIGAQLENSISPSIGLNISLRSKKKHIYTIGYNTNKNFIIGIAFKIF